jgi:hypothetical protein
LRNRGAIKRFAQAVGDKNKLTQSEMEVQNGVLVLFAHISLAAFFGKKDAR